MKNKTKLLKPRDPHLLQMLKKTSGAHGKSKKTTRRDDKVQLKKDYLDKAA